MAGNNAIQFLRGTTEGITKHKDETLADGQPLYDKTTRKLYIGTGDTIGNTIKNAISADFAAAAGTATNAENATNASQLGGVDASGYALAANRIAIARWDSGYATALNDFSPTVNDIILLISGGGVSWGSTYNVGDIWTISNAEYNRVTPGTKLGNILGTATVGSASSPIYLNAGIPTICSSRTLYNIFMHLSCSEISGTLGESTSATYTCEIYFSYFNTTGIPSTLNAKNDIPSDKNLLATGYVIQHLSSSKFKYNVCGIFKSSTTSEFKIKLYSESTSMGELSIKTTRLGPTNFSPTSSYSVSII